MHGSALTNTPKLGSVPERDAYQAHEVAVRLGGVGLRYVRTLIATGELVSFKSGRLRLVARADLEAYIARQREVALRARESAGATA
jgi:excisionase family DNA binding protein